MNVTEAIRSRMSCRAFLDTPVPVETIRSMLETAKHAPSGGNLQPWQVHVLMGQRLTEFLELVRLKHGEQPQGEGTEYNVYPRISKNLTVHAASSAARTCMQQFLSHAKTSNGGWRNSLATMNCSALPR